MIENILYCFVLLCFMYYLTLDNNLIVAHKVFAFFGPEFLNGVLIHIRNTIIHFYGN